jgi:hypothetical protein
MPWMVRLGTVTSGSSVYISTLPEFRHVSNAHGADMNMEGQTQNMAGVVLPGMGWYCRKIINDPARTPQLHTCTTPHILNEARGRLLNE